MLDEVELLVAGGRPEVLPLVAVRRRPAERRVGQHHVEGLAGRVPQSVVHNDRRVGLGALDAVQQHVHGAQTGRQVGNLPTGERTRAQVSDLVGFQVREPLDDRPVCAQEEPAGAAGGVADAVVRLGRHHIDDGVDECPGREVLARSPGALLGGLLDQPLIRVALEVGVVAHPLVLIDELLDELLQLGRRLDAVAGLVEDHAEHVLARAQCRQRIAVVSFEFRSREAQQRLPIVLDGDDPVAAEHHVLLIGHLQKQQVRELFEIVAVGQTVVAKHVAEVPQLLHHRLRILSGHRLTLRRESRILEFRPEPPDHRPRLNRGTGSSEATLI